MSKRITLKLDHDKVYVGECNLDRDFLIDLRDIGYIQKAFSFDDLPEQLKKVQVSIEQQDLHERKVVVKLSTNVPVPDKWNTATLKYLNKDLIGNWDDPEFIEIVFQLSMKHVAIAEGGVSIKIDIPL